MLLSSSSSSFCGPTLVGKERVRCVGRFAPEFFSFSQWALVIQVGGWREQVAQVGGSALILDHRGLKNKEQCLWDEKLKKSKQSFKNKCI